jgi:hypothetical protein
MVIVEEPTVADPVAVSVITEEVCPGGVAGFGTKAEETPVGRPEVVNVIAEEKPPIAVIEMLPVAVEPCVTESELGPLKEKSEEPATVRVKGTVWTIAPEVPVMVSENVPVVAAPVVVTVATGPRQPAEPPGGVYGFGLKVIVVPDP